MTRAGDVGRHQVGRELDAAELEATSPSASVFTASVLASPGTPSSEDVTAPSSSPISRPSIDALLADDDLPDFAPEWGEQAVGKPTRVGHWRRPRRDGGDACRITL